MYNRKARAIWYITFCLISCTYSMLYPRESESREMKLLNGLWDFRTDMKNEGFSKQWFSQPLKKSGPVISMPVPSSYNDITQDKSVRDYIGWVWYQHDFFVSLDWLNKRVVLRVDSAHYHAVVWVNGKPAMSHVGGHLPFEIEINKALKFGGLNSVTIAVNNTLTPTTLPPGFLNHFNGSGFPPGFISQWHQFDFFNYAGIHRSVKLYTTPVVWIDDITIVTKIKKTDGILYYNVIPSVAVKNVVITVEDDSNTIVGTANNLSGTVAIKDANLWWPHTMNATSPGYLYTLKITINSNDYSSNVYSDDVVDTYRLKFGFRTVKVTSTKLLINDRPFYCQGVGMHEDSDIRGKGLDYALIAKNFNLLKWLGVNCFRTSHYPYAEEIMDEADRLGIAVIDESPGVGIVKKQFYGPASLAHHLEVMAEMVKRDKNRPSVIIWSIANEPSSQHSYAEKYFKTLIDHTHALDSTRPVTVVMGQGHFFNDRVSQYCDIVCINHYFAWYGDFGGRLEIIKPQLIKSLDGWYKHLHKPIIVTEYGATSVDGFHSNPSLMFTEDYQCDFLTEYHRTFDDYMRKFLVGEMVWNFADFMTSQNSRRADGNRKGLFTRQRNPKMAAHVIRTRYHHLISVTSYSNYSYFL